MNTTLMNHLSLQVAATTAQREIVKAMLAENNLPVSDIDDDKLLYLLRDGDTVIGTAGLEIFDDCGLFRSFSVGKQWQGKGYGKFINRQIEVYASESGIKCMYLLTTTAKGFFDKQGYCVISREEVPQAIKQSSEFESVCPSTAVVMKKRI